MTTVVADDAFLFSYDFYGTFFLMLFFFFPGISGSYALRVSVVNVVCVTHYTYITTRSNRFFFGLFLFLVINVHLMPQAFGSA